MKKRVIPAILIVVVTVACLLLSRPSRMLFWTAAGVLSVWEMGSVLGKIKLGFSRIVCWSLILAACVLCWLEAGELWLAAAFCAAGFAALLLGIADSKFGGRGAAGTLFVLMYPCLPFVLVLLVSAGTGWLPALALAVLGAWVCDSAALAGGKAWGKHKLAPRVSPNKTVEGSLAGAAVSVIVGAALYFPLRACCDITITASIVTAFVCTAFGQAGDLAASLIKRMAGVKDYSNLIPAHGGIMDKVDSMLFAIPTAWLCLRIFNVI